MGYEARMPVDVEAKWPDPKDGAGSDVSEEDTASTTQTHQSSSIVTLPPNKVRVSQSGSAVQAVGLAYVLAKV